jgi:hypothetical protein
MTYVKGVWVDDDGSGTTGTTVSKAIMDNIEQGIADAHGGKAAIPLVAALPTVNLVPGQMVRLQAATDTVWTMAYKPTLADGSANPAAEKWDFMGGPEMFIARNNGAAQVANNNVWETLAAGSPQFTVPFSGVYEVAYGLTGQVDLAGTFDVNAAVMKNGVNTAIFGGGNDSWGRANYQFQTMLLANNGRATLAAGDLIQLKALCIYVAAGSFKWYNGRLGLKPVRLT